MVLPQKAQNRFTQKFIAEKILPQITQIYTEVMVLYGGEVLWENISQKVTTEERLVDRLEDFAFPSLSTSLYSAYNVSITAMLADMVDIFAKQFKTAYLTTSPSHHLTISPSHHHTTSPIIKLFQLKNNHYET